MVAPLWLFDRGGNGYTWVAKASPGVLPLHVFKHRFPIKKSDPRLSSNIPKMSHGADCKHRAYVCMYVLVLDIFEVDVYPNSTTFLLDKLKLFIILNSNHYSSMDLDMYVLTTLDISDQT